MKVTPTLLSIKSFVVRVLACLLITALLAPLTIPLAAKESRGIAVSPAAITGNLSAAEPMSFSGVSDNAGSGASAFLEKQISRARSILPTPSLAFFGSTGAGTSDNNSRPVNDNRSNDSLSDEKLSRATDKKTSSTNKNSSDSATTNVASSDEAESSDESGADETASSPAENVVPTAPAKSSAPAPNTKSAAALSAPLLPTKTAFDFDGDLKADAAVWRPNDGTWWVLKSTTQDVALQQWGASGDRIVPADYDNDGKTDYAVFTPSSGIWSILQSSNGQTIVKQWGASTDITTPGDFDGDGKADIAVWRPSTGVWYINKSSDSSWYSVAFGSRTYGDIPVVGDYDADGKADIAVWRSSNGTWYAQRSSDGVITGPQWGALSDVPVPADYDGDGKTDFAVWRPSTGGGAGEWFVLNSLNGGMSYAQFGASAPPDVMAPADYDADGKAEMAVWRPSTGTWYIWKISTSTLWQTALGVAGDIPVPSAFVKQTEANPAPTPIPQPTGTRAAIGRARLSPKNATGGTDLYSRNFSWDTGLVNLPGRAGMDAGLSLSYNSLVWTKVGNEIIFDADKGNVAPGFRFGFPVIEPIYTDELTYIPTFLMIAPSGSRTELRQVGTSNFYEAADSSYLQLERTVGGTSEEQQFVLRSTDGTQLKYIWRAGAYRCAEVKDSNGNIITVNHDGAGLLRTMTDTLNRVISISYDNALNPTLITQAWSGGVTHVWGAFSYTTKQINHNFSGVTVAGPANNSSIKVLDRVTFADNSTVRFDYNSYGQVTQVSNYAPNESKLNHVAAEYATSASDCPRFWQTKSLVKNVNGEGDQETIITNSIADNQPVPGTSGTGTLIQVSMNGHPNSAVSKTYVGASGWQEGLPIVTEDWADGVKKRWTWTNYTQDDPNLSYIKNPRVTEMKVGDETNTKRTTISYNPQFGLVNEVKQYQADQNTVIKRSTTSYNLDAAYTSRRIIGLPQESNLFDGANNLMSKVTYAYDGYDFSGTEQNISPVQHDPNYGAGFIVGRGNLTGTTRWRTGSGDTTSPVSTVVSATRYNTAGAVVSQTDPMNRSVSISYADVFSDTQGTNTFAYPTKITDPAGYFSQVKYRYDIGANVWAKSPNINANTPGKETTREFDSVGRLIKQAMLKNGAVHAYTKYEYPESQTVAVTKTTLTDTNNNNVGDAVDEVTSESLLDGAGRVYLSRSPMSFNTAGNPVTWVGQKVKYDVLGRVISQSVPTEIDGVWNPTNTDQIWQWTSQEYDWKGRVTKEINTDGTFKTISYQGCGCAGGQVTTINGEEIFEKDWQGNNPVPLGKRTQKIYADILGRTWKTEVLNWSGDVPGSVYSTVFNTFNGRDQITNVTQTEASTQVSQVTSMSYDGHGRLKTQQRPEQTAATTHNYNSDDSIQSIVDARGASVNYVYNDMRGLLTNITYNSPNSAQIPLAAPVAFGYDNAGNRISMQDGLGTVSYGYNQLSQMTSETRAFSDNLPNAPLANNSFKLEYDYTLSGQLKFYKDPYKDPYAQQFNYAYDKIGRLSAVTGTTAFAGISNYASSPQYNARGTLTALHYGNGTEMAITGFNNKLQATDFEVKKGATSIIKKQYQFYEDGSLKFSKDVIDGKFDRLYKYDHTGRTTQAKSGAEARGLTDDMGSIPYRQNYAYNAFGNITESTMTHYSSNPSYSTHSYVNNRKASSTYDAEGNEVTDENGATYQYDTAGRMVKSQQPDSQNPGQMLPAMLRYFDGTGQEIKRVDQTYVASYGTNYFIRSSVVGKIISEANSTGEKMKTFISANGVTLAEQQIWRNNSTPEEKLFFIHQDASGASVQQTKENGDLAQPYLGYRTAEMDALGNDVGDSNPYLIYTEPPAENLNSSINLGDSPYGGGSSGPMSRTYQIDGMRVSEVQFMTEINSARMGGAFGILEMSARMSAREVLGYSVTRRDGNAQYHSVFDNLKDAKTFALQSGVNTINRWIELNNWSMLSSIMPQGEQQGEVNEQFAVSMSDEIPTVNKIKDILKHAVSKKECTKAFEAIGATPIADQINNVTIVTENVFNDEKYDSIWNRGSKIGQEMRAIFRTLWSTRKTGDVTYPGLYSNTGRRFIGLTNRGINEDDETFSVTVIHSFIHSGGVEGRDIATWWQKNMSGKRPHDLKYKDPKYKDVLKHCTREGKSSALYGQ